MFHSGSRSAFALGRRQLFTRLPTPVKPLWRASCCPYTTTSGKKSDPLRILFCGSDSVSAEALRALHEELTYNPGLVEKIEVVVPPPKATGRGFKEKTTPICTKEAQELGLKYHEIPTFTGWQMPEDINLIIAVSFGLFVPSRLLKQAKYGGLNVHPSFLPDLRGPAPIHHAILRGDEYVGASLQTMDDRKFDHGAILSQTLKPGLKLFKSPTISRPRRKLAMEGAELLVQGLRDGKHIAPYEDAGWKAAELEGQPLQHAPKITPSDLQIDWEKWTADDWARRLQLKQAVWTMGQVQKIVETKGPEQNTRQRIIFHDAMPVPADEVFGKPAVMEMVSSEKVEVEGEEPALVRKMIRVDTRKGNVYVLLEGDTWLRLRRATRQYKGENKAAVAIQDFIVLE